MSSLTRSRSKENSISKSLTPLNFIRNLNRPSSAKSVSPYVGKNRELRKKALITQSRIKVAS